MNIQLSQHHLLNIPFSESLSIEYSSISCHILVGCMCIGILSSQLKPPLMLLPWLWNFMLQRGGLKSAWDFFLDRLSSFVFCFLISFFFEELYCYLVVSIYWSVLLVLLFAKWALLICRLKWFLSSFYLCLNIYYLPLVLILYSGALTIRTSVMLVFLCHYLNILVLLLDTWKNYLSFS